MLLGSHSLRKYGMAIAHKSSIQLAYETQHLRTQELTINVLYSECSNISAAEVTPFQIHWILFVFLFVFYFIAFIVCVVKISPLLNRAGCGSWEFDGGSSVAPPVLSCKSFSCENTRLEQRNLVLLL